MTIDLNQFVGEKVTVVLRSGSTKTGKIQRTASSNWPYRLKGEDICETYTQEGSVWQQGRECPSDIVAIRMETSLSLDRSNLEKLQAQREQLVAQMESLDQKIAEAKKKVLPEDFDRYHALRYLDNPQDKVSLDFAFVWRKTPQGHDHWFDISQDRRKLTFEDIVWIQKWVIQSLLSERESEES